MNFQKELASLKDVEIKNSVNKELWQVRKELGEALREKEELLKKIQGRGSNELEIKKLRTHNIELSTENESLKKLLKSSQTDLENLKEEKKKTVLQLNQDLLQSRDEASRLKIENELLSQKENRLNQEVEQLRKKALEKTVDIEITTIGHDVQEMIGKTNQVSRELENAMQRNAELTKKINLLYNQLASYEEERSRINTKHSLPAPQGNVTLVFTDVQGSTTQWEMFPEIMASALRKHNDCIRISFPKYGGYEVKTEGDAFMLAFSDPVQAVSFCLQTQLDLLKCDWPEELFRHQDSKVEEIQGKMIYRGFRVRMGIHCGTPTCEEDPVTGRMDYFGPMVNRSARVEGTACGGQIVVSGDVFSVLKEKEWEVSVPFESKPMGSHRLKGLETDTELIQILPTELNLRTFPVYGAHSENEENKKLSEQISLLKQEKEALDKKIQEADQRVKDMKKQSEQLLTRLMNLISGKETFGTQMLSGLLKDTQNMSEGQDRLSRNLQEIHLFKNKLDEKYNEMLQKSTGPNEEQTRQIEKLNLELKQALAREEDTRDQLLREESLHLKEVSDLSEELTSSKREYRLALDKLESVHNTLGTVQSSLLLLQDPEDKNAVSSSLVPELGCLALSEHFKKAYIFRLKDPEVSLLTYVTSLVKFGRNFHMTLEGFKERTNSWKEVLDSFVQLSHFTFQNINVTPKNSHSDLNSVLKQLSTATVYFIYVTHKREEGINATEDSLRIVSVAHESIKEILTRFLNYLKGFLTKVNHEPMVEITPEKNRKKEQIIKLESILRKLLTQMQDLLIHYQEESFVQIITEIVDSVQQTLGEIDIEEGMMNSVIEAIKKLIFTANSVRLEPSSIQAQSQLLLAGNALIETVVRCKLRFIY